MENEFRSNLSLISNITQYEFRFSLTFSLAEIFAEKCQTMSPRLERFESGIFRLMNEEVMRRIKKMNRSHLRSFLAVTPRNLTEAIKK